MCVFFFFNCLLPHFFCLLYVDACLFSCLVLSSYFVSFFVFCVDFSLVHCLLFFFCCCCCFFPLSPCRIDAQFRTVTAERCCLFFFSAPLLPFFFLSFLEKQEQELQATVLGETHPTQEAAHTLASFLSDIYTQGKKPTSACSICSFAFILLFPITSVQSCITSLFFFFSDDDVVCLSEVNNTLSLSL